MICVGDIVTRVFLEDSLPIFFGEGYFFVLEVVSTDVYDYNMLISRRIYTCKIMDSSGLTSWIDGESLMTVLRLNNEHNAV